MLHVCRLADQELALPNKQLLDGTVPAAATAVAVSSCGNFGVVGTASGRMDKYNMQSGLHRGRFTTGASLNLSEVPPRLRRARCAHVRMNFGPSSTACPHRDTQHLVLLCEDPSCAGGGEDSNSTTHAW